MVLATGGNPAFVSGNEEETEIPTGLEGEDFDTPRTGEREIVCWDVGEGSVRVVRVLPAISTGSVWTPMV